MIHLMSFFMKDRPDAARRRRRARMFGWWYLCIGLGFVLLGIQHLVLGDRLWLITVRFVIALGFFALGIGTFRSTVANGRRE